MNKEWKGAALAAAALQFAVVNPPPTTQRETQPTQLPQEVLTKRIQPLFEKATDSLRKDYLQDKNLPILDGVCVYWPVRDQTGMTTGIRLTRNPGYFEQNGKNHILSFFIVPQRDPLKFQLKNTNLQVGGLRYAEKDKDGNLIPNRMISDEYLVEPISADVRREIAHVETVIKKGKRIYRNTLDNERILSTKVYSTREVTTARSINELCKKL